MLWSLRKGGDSRDEKGRLSELNQCLALEAISLSALFCQWGQIPTSPIRAIIPAHAHWTDSQSKAEGDATQESRSRR